MAPLTQSLLLGVGVAGYLECDAILHLAEGHPSAQPGFQLAVDVSDGRVASADLRVGLMHRGSEKLFEARDYRQLMMLANRHDWLSPFSSELVIALAVEAATGIAPPERATWLRTLLAEANRVAAAFAFLAAAAPQPGQRRLLQDGRERLLVLQERLTGARVHPMFTRIGGVAAPWDRADVSHAAGVSAGLADAAEGAVEVAEALSERLAGLAVLTREQAVDLGASGSVARASGLDWDLRRDDPYAAYSELGDLLVVPVERAGDAAARYRVLAAQIPVSLALMGACTDRLHALGDGPVDVLLPKSVRVPEGTGYAWVEGPLGITGCLLVSTGERTPWRLKVRSASFGNAQAMVPALVGVPQDRLADALMSFTFVVGDIDR
ncbi:MAG: NADH-quinone oxidoreductase subunit D [Actinomycetota bacterium]|nr:NADH-quinone oxidoreductase subunit D [Actinomycetota bacterium]